MQVLYKIIFMNKFIQFILDKNSFLTSLGVGNSAQTTLVISMVLSS
jgi:hypothetical protein